MTENYLKIPVLRGVVLGITVLRGYAKISDIAKVSKPDIYDPKINPSGTQRDLSPKHARDAYEYVKNRDFGFWPEVFLCVRDKESIEYLPSKHDKDYGILKIDLNHATNKLSISRVDGNHRLNYSDGLHEGYPPIEKDISFCLAYNLTQEQEITLFRDINANQKAMNTNHLDNIEARLTPQDELKVREPELYIAKKLNEDPDSPLFDRVIQSNKKIIGSIIPLRGLKSSIRYMFSGSTNKLASLRDPDAQYKVIKNYLKAVKLWEPKAWEEPSKYLLLRGAVLWAVFFIGADVTNRCLSAGKFTTEDMLIILKSGKRWDWSTNGDFRGYSGAGGAKKICDMVIREFQDDSGMSMKALHRQILEGGE